MNKKLIAAAVSAAVVAPVAAYGEASFYGRINNAISINDLSDADGADSTTDVSGVASRFGFRYNGEIGNGLTAHAQYEFSTVSDNEGSGVGDTRVATAGVSGAFGRIDIGNQWSAYNETFGTLISPTYSLGYLMYSTVAQAPYRASNTIQYTNSFGPVTAVLDIRLDDNDPNSRNSAGELNDTDGEADDAEKIHGNGIGLGLSFAVTDGITIAAAFDNEDGPDQTAMAKEDNDPSGDVDRVGVGIKASFGGISAALGWQNLSIDDDGAASAYNNSQNIHVDAGSPEDTDIDSLYLNVSGNLGEKTSWLLSYSTADTGSTVIDGLGTDDTLGGGDDTVSKTDDAEQFVWGVYHNMGGGLRLYYEATSFDDGVEGSMDGSQHLLGLRVDF